MRSCETRFKVRLRCAAAAFETPRNATYLVQEDDPLHDLVDVLEDAPREHHLPHLDELGAEALRLQLVVRVRRFLVRQ